MPKAPHDVFTVAELAEYLKVPKSTIYKLAQEGRLMVETAMVQGLPGRMLSLRGMVGGMTLLNDWFYPGEESVE